MEDLMLGVVATKGFELPLEVRRIRAIYTLPIKSVTSEIGPFA
jgi:hypothetical protein